MLQDLVIQFRGNGQMSVQWPGGLPLYPIERCFLGTGKRSVECLRILYVNGAYCGDTPIGKLMRDFSCTDAADMYYGTLADRVRFFIETFFEEVKQLKADRSV